MSVKFSIITATYNRYDSGILAECIDSIKNQKKGNFTFEHLIVDDGSTDKTREFLKEESKKFPHIHYIFQKNSGPAKAWQKGLKKATGDFIIFLDDDDKLQLNSLFKRSRFIEKNPNIDWFYGKAVAFTNDGKRKDRGFQSEFHKTFLYERNLVSNLIHSGTPVIKRTALEKIKWPKWLERSQDYFIWLELLRPERKLKVGFLDDFVVLYRDHDMAYTKAIFSDEEKIAKKEELNQRIRELHGSSVAFLAEFSYEWRKKTFELYRTINSLHHELRRKKSIMRRKPTKNELMLLDEILDSKGWKVICQVRKIKDIITRQNDYAPKEKKSLSEE